jgi:hypothetical protein
MPAPDPDYAMRFLLSRIPDQIRKSLSTDELSDRLVEATRLSQQASDPALSADLRKAARIRGQAVLTAQPREVTRQQHAALIAKAATVKGRFQADAIRREADRLIEEKHPIAPPRRTVAKAKPKVTDDDLVPVYDGNGNLVGVVHQADITPLGSKDRGDAAPRSDEDAQVAKALPVVVYDGAGRAYQVNPYRIIQPVRKAAPGKVDVFDKQGRLLGGVDPDVIETPEEQARSTGPVKAGGTTGMGQPRQGGAPQRQLPGDVSDRTVIKAAIKAFGPNYRCLYDWTGSLVGAVRQRDITRALPDGRVAKSAQDQSYANVYNSRRQKVGVARLSDIIPLATLRRR